MVDMVKGYFIPLNKKKEEIKTSLQFVIFLPQFNWI
jgi:hypothetical protein